MRVNGLVQTATVSGRLAAAMVAFALTVGPCPAVGQDNSSRAQAGSTVVAAAAGTNKEFNIGAAGPTGDARSSINDPGVGFFFGFLVFDWDPAAPGGVPGFGPLPPDAHAR